MRYALYLVLLTLAVYCNRQDRGMLTLTAVVGVSIFIPAPQEWPNFYYFCIFGETIVALVALRLKVAASVFVVELCVLMVIVHVMGYHMDGSLPFSPYRPLIKILETLEISCCVLASAPLASRLRNRETP